MTPLPPMREQWPWLAMDFPECSCDEDCQPSRECTIHGDWLRRYAMVWGIEL